MMVYPQCVAFAAVICSVRETGLPSFGENLKREREKRNITLEQISQSTKIGTRMLQALEEDRFTQLPGGIFNKGFVRAYARCVGLDEDQTVTDYLEASGDVPPVQPEVPAPEPVPRVEATTQLQHRQLPWGLFAALLLLAALALSLWSHRQQDQQSAAPHPTPRPPAPQAVEHAQPSAASTPVPDAPARSTPPARASSPVPVNVTSPQTSTEPDSTGQADAIPPAEAATPPASDTFVVVIRARAASWTSVTSDGERVYSGVLHPGDRHVIRARNEIVVKAGNAGGVELSFNGGKLEAPGQTGEVRTITFGPDGLLSNSPLPPNQ
jgi:cytoskeleton protein RodZ